MVDVYIQTFLKLINSLFFSSLSLRHLLIPPELWNPVSLRRIQMVLMTRAYVVVRMTGNFYKPKGAKLGFGLIHAHGEEIK